MDFSVKCSRKNVFAQCFSPGVFREILFAKCFFPKYSDNPLLFGMLTSLEMVENVKIKIRVIIMIYVYIYV